MRGLRAATLVPLAVLAAASVAGCDGDRGTAKPAGAGEADASAVDSGGSREVDEEVLDLIERLPACDVRHRGLSLDLGSRGASAHRSYAVGPFDDLVGVERAGATFARVLTKRLSYEIWLDEPADSLFVSLRAAGGVSRHVAVYLDGRHLGRLKLERDVPRIVTTGETSSVAAGRHTLLLRWSGRSPAGSVPYADVDWIRVGFPDDLGATYAAPTYRDIIVDRALGDEPRRALALRAPSSVRCVLRATRGSAVRAALGFWGRGRGTAEIRVREDGEDPVVLKTLSVVGGKSARWAPLRLSLDPFAGKLVALELRATGATAGGRVLFGDAAVVAPARSREDRVPSTRTVIIVVVASVDRNQLPPWGPIGKLTAFGEIAREGAAFSMYRAPTTVQAATFASMLTGMGPRLHALEDPAARLPSFVQTIAEIVKQAGGRTAMFTSVPPTFPPFGFHRGWDRFEAYSPVADIGAEEPYRKAASWLENELEDGEGRRLVVVYGRGAHPPWDLSREEAEKVGPPEYSGRIGARRGAILLANARRSRLRARRRLSEGDAQRIDRLLRAALRKQNEALAGLFATLKKRGDWNRALVIVAGDTGRGAPPDLPFDPAGPLTEDRLIVPLIVKFPGGKLATKEVRLPVTTVDIARTVLESLELDVPSGMAARDLYRAAVEDEALGGRPLVATLGNHYATRSGEWLLRGEYRRRPKLCQLSVDPACVNDVFEQHPIAARALWQWSHDAEYEAHRLRGGRMRREPATIDPETAAALLVWGH